MEQSCVVWHSSITNEEETNLERVQKFSLRIILKDNYNSYEQALKKANLLTLGERRRKLCLNFARACVKHDRNKDMFPMNPAYHTMTTRHREKYLVQHSRTDRLAKSSVPYLQHLLNEYCKKSE